MNHMRYSQKKEEREMTKNYKYGRDKERKVARALRTRGASVRVSPGSKSVTDLKAIFRSGKKWYVQVKSSRSATPPSLTSKELARLKQSATKSRAIPVVARVTPKGIEYKSARSGRTLRPSKTRK